MFFQSFYARLSAIFLVLLLVLGGALGVWATQAAFTLTEAADQALNRDLAVDLAPRFQPHLREGIDQDAIGEIIDGLTTVNRRIDVYLLGSEGMIKGYFVPPGEEVVMAFVDTSPLDKLMDAGPDDLPVLADDPIRPGRQRPFSVAPVSIMGEEGCYLYITLGSEAYDSALAMLRSGLVGRATLRVLPMVLLFTAALGLILFAFVTRRLRRMNEVVASFEQGDFSRRVDVRGRDEIGLLGTCFNRMADTLQSTMRKLNAANAELAQTDERRRELVANVSHDLRSPLASIRGYLETILIKGERLSPEERERFVGVALRNADGLSRLVEELFELSKFDAEEVQAHREPFAAAELVQDAAAQLRPQAEAAGVELRMCLSEDLPPALGDIGLIERVITNLAENALRHTPSGGTIELAAARADGGVAVRVRDTGAGIPAAHLDRLTERFFQVDEARDRTAHGGAGLGLAIAKKILALHGSELVIESAEGEGTTVAFELPTA